MEDDDKNSANPNLPPEEVEMADEEEWERLDEELDEALEDDVDETTTTSGHNEPVDPEDIEDLEESVTWGN